MQHLLEELTLILLNLVWSLGYSGLFIIMFLAGFCAPIPWEVILIPTGASNPDVTFSSLISGIGSSLGAVPGYWIGKKLGRPMILKYGRYISISRSELEKAERWIIKWGSLSTVICRSVQYLPYKSFNVAAGILKMNFLSYILLTIPSSIIRCFSLIYIGKIISVDSNILVLLTLAFLTVGCLLFVSGHILYYQKHRKNKRQDYPPTQ